MYIILSKADFSSNNIGTLDSWTINYNRPSGITWTGISNSVNKNAPLSCSATLDTTNYEIVSMTITMGGATIGSVDSNGTISGVISLSGDIYTIAIPSVTGNVNISITTKNLTTGGTDSGGGSGSGGSGGNTTLTFHKTADSAGMSIFYFQDALRTNTNSTFISLGSEIIGIDVSSYIGKTLKITATQSVVSGAQYGVFMSAPLLDTITPDKLPTFTTINANVPTTNVINYIQISDTDQKTTTKDIVVPTGAKYLYFSNLRAKQTAEPTIIVGV